MSSSITKLNLRPQERRLIALVLIVLFVVLNIVFIWPHFGDWGKLQLRQDRAERTLRTYRDEISKVKAYEVKLRELQSAGSSVVPDEQELDLVRTVDNQARLNRLNVIQSDPRPRQSSTQTNRFFEEQFVTIHVTSDNEELVNFLVSLTSTNSLIRVKDLSLKPADAGATKLDANMTLVASYQRKTPTRSQPLPVRSTNLAAAAAVKPNLARPLTKTNKPAALKTSTGLTNRATISKSRPTNQPAKKP